MKKKIVKFNKNENTIQLPVVVGTPVIGPFASALSYWKAQRQFFRPLNIDFSAVQKPYSNGMLPIIAMIDKLRNEGQVIRIKLPNDLKVAELFIRTNWAYYLNPEFARSSSGFDRHLHTRQMKSFRDVATITNDFMGIVLRTMDIPKDVVSALEWSIYEICDNVINHSNSPNGGFVEAVTYSKEKRISFTVADAGRGILNSLREGIPTLRTNVEAIGEAMKEGVTRDKQFGQGNGLNGSLNITTMSGGSLDISSGSGRLYCTANHSKNNESNPDEFFRGTSVSGQIFMSDSFSIGKALAFGGKEYIPENIIDLSYELDSEDAVSINVSKEASGVGTRSSGKQLRVLATNLISSKPNYRLIIDWENVAIVSSSFADEFIAKLYISLGQNKFHEIVRNINLSGVVRQLIDKSISQRLALK